MLARVLRCLVAAAVSVPLLGQPATARPAGDPGAYAFLSIRSGHDLIARWNPCETISYRVNLSQAPPGSLTEVEAAVARLADATGLTFAYAGATDVVPGRAPDNYPPGTHLIIAWGTPGPGTDIAGLGGALYPRGGDALIITRGMVLLDAARTAVMARGFGAAPGGTTGGLLLHELGHAAGLAHPLADDPDEIMYPRLTGRAAEWGAGDLTGLQRVGAAQGCLPAGQP